MPNLGNWIKGIVMFILVTMIYFFWYPNIFSTILGMLGTDYAQSGEIISLQILTTLGWVTFVFAYLALGPIFLIYSIIAGSSGNVNTSIKDLLIGLGVWILSMPLLSVFFAIMYIIITTTSGATTGLMDASATTMADNFSWFFVLMGVLIGALAPFYWIIKGYGVKLGWGGTNEQQVIQTI